MNMNFVNLVDCHSVSVWLQSESEIFFTLNTLVSGLNFHSVREVIGQEGVPLHVLNFCLTT